MVKESKSKRKRSVEDDEIEYYERKLGFKGKRGLSRGDEVGDGLDDLLEGLEDEEAESGAESEVGIEEDSSRQDKTVPREARDLYGQTGPSTKYIPPAQRQLDALQDPDDRPSRLSRLRLRLNGLLNRLGESNIDGVLKEVEKVYQDHPRKDVSSVLIDLVVENIASEVQLLPTFLALYAALLTALYRISGLDFGASAVQRCVTALLTQMQDGHQASNLLRLVGEIYALGLVSHGLLFDLVHFLLDERTETSLDLLLKLFQSKPLLSPKYRLTIGVGPQMRQDSGPDFKKAVLCIQDQVTHYEETNSRTKFLLESMAEIKIKKGRKEGRESDIRTALKSWLGTVGKGRRLLAREPLDPSLAQIMAVERDGPWWLQRGLEPVQAVTLKAEVRPTTDSDPSFSRVAKRLGLTSELRRRIFAILTSGENALEVSSALEALHLKGAQEREIVRVILKCVAMDKEYNSFYQDLMTELLKTKSGHAHRITLTYSFWDILRGMGEKEAGGEAVITGGTMTVDDSRLTKRSRFQVAQWFGRLLGSCPASEQSKRTVDIDDRKTATSGLTLSILKPLSFDRLQVKTITFLQTVLVHLFLEMEAQGTDDMLSTIFHKTAMTHRALGLGLLLLLSNEMKLDELRNNMDVIDIIKTKGELISRSIDLCKRGLKDGLKERP